MNKLQLKAFCMEYKVVDKNLSIEDQRKIKRLKHDDDKRWSELRWIFSRYVEK